LQRIERWLQNEPCGFFATCKHILFFTLLMIVYVSVFIVVVDYLGLTMPDQQSSFDHNSVLGALFLMIPFAILEELLFRAMPLSMSILKDRLAVMSGLVIWLWILMLVVFILGPPVYYIYTAILFVAPLILLVMFLQDKIKIVLLAVVMSSLIFGYVHGGWQFIFLQGVGGVMLSFCFLKCGGYNGRVWKAIIASSTSHFLYNAFVAFISL